MTLATFAALDALEAAFAAAADLPALQRNDVALEGFADSGTAGIGYKLMLVDGDFPQLAVEFSETPSFELDVEGELLFAVEGLPGADRDAVLRAGVASIKAVMFPANQSLVVPGGFERLRVDAVDQRVIHGEARKPIHLIQISLALFVTAATPFG